MQNKNTIDKSNFRKVILDFPDQFKVGVETAKNISLSGNFDSLVISGMGGSCLPGELLKTYLEMDVRKDLPIYLNRNYALPEDISGNPLYIFISYSGNTEETLSSLNEAIEKKLFLVCLASGGKIENICQEKNLPLVKIPSGIEPRSATGYFFGSLIQILNNLKLVNVNIEEILASAEKLKIRQVELENLGKSIASKLKGQTPIVYTTEKYKALAMINKIKLNENAKTPAFWNYFPELNHNEMVGFTLPQAKFHFLTFIDQNEHPQNLKRMKITADLMKTKGMETEFLEITGENNFEKIFSTLLLGDWISYYLALEYNQDPNPVDMVEDFKKKLV